MNVKTKSVYYCDHCKRHGLSRAAMEKHERHCTLNPDRSCRWRVSDDPHPDVDFRVLATFLRNAAPLTVATIDRLRAEVEGCPACMLAALRQSGVEYHYDAATGLNLWDYGEEIERSRVEERRQADCAEASAIESGWA